MEVSRIEKSLLGMPLLVSVFGIGLEAVSNHQDHPKEWTNLTRDPTMGPMKKKLDG